MRNSLFKCCCIFFLLLNLCAIESSHLLCASSFTDGLVAYQNLNYRKARRVWEILAEEGDSASQLWVGVLYLLGKGVSRNYTLAYYWLQLASSTYPYESHVLLKWISPFLTPEQIETAKERATFWTPVFGESLGLIPDAFSGDANALHQLGSLYMYDATNNEYRTAAGWLKRAALAGDNLAAFKLGFLYDAGLGVNENDIKAIYWYNKAAKKGITDAWVMLGTIYSEGNQIPHNAKLALKLFLKAAEKENVVAQLILGEHFTNINGIPIDTRRGLEWLNRAADQGDEDAYNMLGIIYLTGHGLNGDHEKAIQWFEKAAEKDHPEALYNLGMIYHMNHGTPKNLKRAVHYYKRAAQYGVSPAFLALSEIYLSGYQVRNDCIHAYFWAMLAAAGENKEVGKKARQIIQALQNAMIPEDKIDAQNDAIVFWRSIRRY